MSTSHLVHTIRELLEPTVQRLGFDLVAVEFVSGRRRPMLRLSIDGPAGVGADDCARISSRVSPLLDDADPIASAYDLEVSSPGIERPMQRLEDFRRFTGLRARVRLEEGMPRRRFTGVIRLVDGGDVHIEADGAVHIIDFDTIDRAHLVLDLDEYQRLAEMYPGPKPVDDDTPSAN